MSNRYGKHYDEDCESYYGEDRECCKRGCTILYSPGRHGHHYTITDHCYEGDRNWSGKLQEHGYLNACNASVLIIGADYE